MDTKRIFNATYLEQLYEIYRHKFRNQRFDVIICVDNNALNFLIKHRDEIFPGTPVVFCGVNNFHDSMLENTRLYTGVVEAIEVKGTIDIALRLHPKTRQIVIYGTDTPTYLANKEIVKKVMDSYKGSVDVRFIEGLNIKEVQDNVQKLSDDSIVLLIASLKDENRQRIFFRQFAEMVDQVSRVPQYSLWDFILGYGIFGGKLISGVSQGETAAKMALRILNGEKIKNIHILRQSPNRYMFDYKQMKRFGINLSDLPPKSVLINKPSSFYSQHKALVWTIIIILLFLLSFITALGIGIAKSRRAEVSLQESKERFKTLSALSFEGILIHNNGVVIDCNEALIKMVGYTRKELIGKNVIKLCVPQEYHAVIQENIIKNVAKPYGLMLRRKDGTVFPVEVEAKDIKEKKKTFRVAALRDITERKQAEKQLQLEHSRLMDILDSIPFGVYIVDQHFNIEYTNPVIKKEFGTIQEHKCYQYFHERTKVCPWCKNKEVFAGKSVSWKWHSSSTDQYYELFDSPLRNPDGSISKFEIFQNITERKKAEEALQKSEEKYRSMMEAMDEAVYICSSDFCVEYMNPAMIKRTDYDASGETCHKTIHGLDEKCPWCVFEKIVRGKSINHEIVSPKDNKTFHVSNSPIFHADESVSKLTIFRDITQFKKIESQLQQAQKMESIGTLASGIAHDFNNILFPIVGHTEMLIEDVPEESPFRSSLNEIYTGALRARELVKQILTFSRQESGELKLMKMQPIIKETFKLLRSSIPTTIEINQDINPNCGVIKADPTQIHQIVMNLATNAYHTMEKTGGKLKVSLKEIELGEHDVIAPEMTPGVYACLSVTDSGKGMDKELIEKIFDPFFTTKKKGKGTGMGLSVVHGIVKSMNGAIQVYSEPGNGTEFKIYFPIEKSSFDKQSIQTHETIQGGIERILLIDDEEAIITMEKMMLERLGYHIISRTSSIEALEVFRAAPENFDLVITDMAMPNLPGDKLTIELTKIRPDIPVLLCTGFSETMSKEETASLGIKGFLFKPIVMKDLAKKIRKVLNKK